MAVVGLVNSSPAPKRRRIELTPTTTISPERCSGWSELPKDIIDAILGKITLLADYDRFGAVCVTWRRASMDPLNRNHRIEPTILNSSPLLLLPTDRVSEQDKASGSCKGDNPWKRSLFDVFRRSMLIPEFNLPQIPNSRGRCCGCSHGWFIFADKNQSLALVNPFYIGGGKKCSGGIIRLPPLDDDPVNESANDNDVFIPEFSVVKVVLSADPALFPDDYVVCVISGLFKSLSFIRPGRDKHWTRVLGKKGSLWRPGVDDVLCRENRIYAVVEDGSLYFCAITDRIPKLRKVAPPPTPCVGRISCYILESPDQGDLLVVYRNLLADHVHEFRTTKFKIFKLLSVGGRRLTAWHEMKNIGKDKVMFLGDNHSTYMNISPLDGDKLPQLHTNSIYFTDQILSTYLSFLIDPYEHFQQDIGVFNMDDQSIRHCYSIEDMSELVCNPPPIWFFPSLPGNWKPQTL